jgi:hypothetical protein
MRKAVVAAVLVIALPALSGCAALPALAPAALNAGGDLVKAGTVRLGGATLRTFSLPLADVYEGTRRTLNGLGFAAPQEEMVEERVTLRVSAVDRAIRIDLQPITGAMTQMRVAVRKKTLSHDIATASELVERIDQTLEPLAQQALKPVSQQRQGPRWARQTR